MLPIPSKSICDFFLWVRVRSVFPAPSFCALCSGEADSGLPSLGTGGILWSFTQNLRPLSCFRALGLGERGLSLQALPPKSLRLPLCSDSMTFEFFQEEIVSGLYLGFLTQVIGICLKKYNSENKVRNCEICSAGFLTTAANVTCFMCLLMMQRVESVMLVNLGRPD